MELTIVGWPYGKELARTPAYINRVSDVDGGLDPAVRVNSLGVEWVKSKLTAKVIVQNIFAGPGPTRSELLAFRTSLRGIPPWALG